MQSDYHLPVLCDEAISLLDIHADSICVDMTLGRAGHSKEMLRHLKGGYLYAIDKDRSALAYSEKALREISPSFMLFQGAFSEMTDILRARGVKSADVVLFDIGVSSPQFDNPERGFSYRFDGPLDMRMDTDQKLTAAAVVNTYPEDELRRIISEYGEDPSAGVIAAAIVRARAKKPLETTLELVDVIKGALPSFILNRKGHPAKQTFQAIRYEVNSEPHELQTGLHKAIDFLSVGGRLAVITFNSLEDRIAKDIFRGYTELPPVSRHLPTLIDAKPVCYRLITKRPVVPGKDELESNPRAKSARLRVIERIRN